MFGVRGAPDRYHLLVDRDHVVTSRGLSALTSYVVASNLLGYRIADAVTMTTLLTYFAAYPAEDPGCSFMTSRKSLPDLRPRLDYLANDHARFQLYYRCGNGDEARYHEWTLRLGAGEPTEWTVADFDHHP